MKLLVLILNKTQVQQQLLKELYQAHIGATLLHSQGMAHTLAQDEDSFLLSLRAILTPQRDNVTILMAIKQEQTSTALEIITRIVGDLKQPDTGILFRIPIDAVWGMEQL